MKKVFFLISIICTSCFFDNKTEKSVDPVSSKVTHSQVTEFINQNKHCDVTSECSNTYVKHRDYFCCGVILRLEAKSQLDSLVTLLDTNTTTKYGECAMVDCMDQIASCEQNVCVGKEITP